MKLDSLFIGAHPDDIELNCGGTLLKLTESGKRTGIVDLTFGELSTRGNKDTRKKETDAASELMGIKVRENLGIEDGNIDLNKENKLKIITALRKYKPEIVFAPYPFDRHPDHINAGNLIRESFFYSGLEKIQTGNYKAYRPRKLFYYRSTSDIPVSFIVDVTSVFSKKLEVLKCFGSQLYNPESSEPETLISTRLFHDEVVSRAKHFGFKIGTEFGEPFFSYDYIKLNSENIFEI